MGLPIKFKEDHVLKLKQSVYGLHELLKNFFMFLKGKLEKCGFKQSTIDPCLFLSDRVICV
eukprot:6479996-Ditylum_brightwellii.AAC.1